MANIYFLPGVELIEHIPAKSTDIEPIHNSKLVIHSKLHVASLELVTVVVSTDLEAHPAGYHIVGSICTLVLIAYLVPSLILCLLATRLTILLTTTLASISSHKWTITLDMPLSPHLAQTPAATA